MPKKPPHHPNFYEQLLQDEDPASRRDVVQESTAEQETFDSSLEDLGPFELPAYTGLRWMMLPFRLDDIPRTITRKDWHGAIQKMVSRASVRTGTAYLTIDEAEVEPGTTHRRPGIHVDGVGPSGGIGGWGGGGHGGGWGTGGMIVVASHVGSQAWTGKFAARIGPNGDCEHMRPMLRDQRPVPLRGGRAYRLGATCLHEALPMPVRTRRTFVRLSLPSDAPWYEGYTPSPVGVLPTGPTHPARTSFMSFRP
jgi:hypothetical protein